MVYHGRDQNGVVVLDAGAELPEGTMVRVDVIPGNGPRRGSAAAILRLAGTLTDEEARIILEGAQECRRVDKALWDRRS